MVFYDGKFNIFRFLLLVFTNLHMSKRKHDENFLYFLIVILHIHANTESKEVSE